jgi:hypothetical protein
MSVLLFRFCLALLFYLSPEQLQLAKAQTSNANSLTDLVTHELRYHAPGAGEVYLIWGINGWHAVPDTIRPPDTYLDDQGVMHTHLVRKDDTFSTTLRIPRRTRLNYKVLLTKTTGGSASDVWLSDDENGQPFANDVKFGGRIEIESKVFSLVTAEQRKAWLAGEIADLPLVKQEIHYHLAGANEVWLVWGANGWHNVPEAFRPSGTKVQDQLMHTPLVRMGDSFVTAIRVPPGMPIEYGFLITKMEGGTPVNVWEDAGDRPSSIVTPDSRISVESETIPVAIAQRKAWLAGQAVDLPLVTQEIRYRAPRAAEVWLEWGLDGWQAIPIAVRPLKTVMANGTMRTLMAREGEFFTATVKIPPGTAIDYKFLIAKSISSPTSGQREGSRVGSFIAQFNGRVEFESGVTRGMMDQRKAWPSGRLTDLSLVAQEIRYRIAGAAEVWFVWGINGWQVIPEAARPPGTVLKDNRVMHTRMVRQGDTFATTVRVPPGTILDYKFLVTKTNRGAPINIWQDYNGKDFGKFVRRSGSLEEEATVTVMTPDER